MEKISIKLTDTSGKRPCPAELVWVEWPTSCHLPKDIRGCPVALPYITNIYKPYIKWGSSSDLTRRAESTVPGLERAPGERRVQPGGWAEEEEEGPTEVPYTSKYILRR